MYTKEHTMDIPSLMPVHQQLPRSRAPWLWVVVAVLVVGISVGVYALYQRSQPEPTTTPTTSVSPSGSAVPGAAAPAQWGQVVFQARQEMSDNPYFPTPSGYDRPLPEVHWKVGTFTAGPYKGGDLILVQQQPDGMGGPSYYRFAKVGTKATYIERNSGQYWTGDVPVGFQIDRDYAIGELTPPLVLQSPDGKVTVERGTVGFYGDGLWSDLFAKAHLTTAFTDPKYGAVLTDVPPTVPTPSPKPGDEYVPEYRYGFYLHLPDDTSATYALKIPFMASGDYPSVKIDGASSVGAYTFQGIGGCGSYNFLNVIPVYKVNPDRDLMITGRTSTGDSIFEFKDKNHSYLRDIYENHYQPIYPATTKVSYQQFTSQHPVFFWFDPYGRLVQFQNKMFIPQAECGKPVIYLYPEQTQDVSVKVDPVGGMTYSDPDYGQGWKVQAHPDGSLFHPATGNTYPYLFWEGRGGIYEQPRKGWSVARADVESFLTDKLTAFGLNTTEINDFKEFWLPRMQAAPHYFVTFLGTRQMDALAPLTIDPRPDTVIRVLMDFTPSQTPVDVESFPIHALPRRGFTVIEWGGVLR